MSRHDTIDQAKQAILLASLVPGENLLIGPHPTARQPDTLQRLKWMAEALDSMTTGREPA